MRSSFRHVFHAVVGTALLAGCSDRTMFEPEDAASLSVSSLTRAGAASPVLAWLRDSSLNVGDSTQLNVNVLPVRNSRTATRDLRFMYSSSDTLVATVTSTGLVRARRDGKADIRAVTRFGAAVVAITVGASIVQMDTTGVANLPNQFQPPIAGPQVDSGSSPDIVGPLPTFAMPLRPRATVDVTVPRVTGKQIRVASGDAAGLQRALNTAVGGDEIILPNNSEFVGSFTLPKHGGSAPIIVRSETVVPAPGTRVTPSTAAAFARLVTKDVLPAVVTQAGAANWRLIGLSMRVAAPASDNYGIVVIGRGEETAHDQFVSNIILDRVYVTAGEQTTSRCVALNGNSLAVVDSWLADCHARGRDSQGILGWTGVGPFRIENNHIEGAGQNIMFGGGDPKIPNVTPSDMTIRRNHLFKPLSWGNGKWTVKAAFELKHAQRVLFEENVIENHWVDGQVGFAVLLQAVSQGGQAPWSKVWDITFRSNIIRNSTSGINILSRMEFYGVTPTDPTRRVLIANNLFVRVGRDPFTGDTGGSSFVQLLGDHEDVSLAQNTFVADNGVRAGRAIMLAGKPSTRVSLLNNVFGATEYGIFGDAKSEGNAGLVPYCPGAVVQGNLLTGRIASLYPQGNMFPSALPSSDFVDAAGGNYSLRSSLPFAMSGQARVGVDGAQLLAMQRLVVRN